MANQNFTPCWNIYHKSLIINSAAVGTRTPNLLIRSQMLYPIELRLHEEQVNKSSFAKGVKPDFCERKRVRCVVHYMKAVTADSLLPFAIAAILGFLVLGLKGRKIRASAGYEDPAPVLATPSDYEGKPEKKLSRSSRAAWTSFHRRDHS